MSAVPDHPPLLAVPLFPLPNVVLFPRAVLPLHIFEERYLMMTADALRADGLIAMALLKSGWEKQYHQRPAIEPVVCVGQIVSWEQMPDGKYNFLLQGRWRARIVREHPGGPYRRAELQVLPETNAMEIDLHADRDRLRYLFEESPLAAIPLSRQFRELLSGPLTTAEIADLAAFNYLDDVCFKQELLGEQDVRRRVERVVGALRVRSEHVSPGLFGLPEDPSLN